MKKIPYSPQVTSSPFSVKKPKIEWVKTTPKRYVYHLTYGGDYALRKDSPSYYKRLSIVCNGMYGKDHGLAGVWSHRALLGLKSLYPLALDYHWDFWGNKNGFVSHVSNIDVWKIDTWQFDAEWFMDPNMEEPYLDQWDYLFTESSVPAHALQLFTIDVNHYAFLHENDDSKYDLVPVKWINSLLNHKKRRMRVR